MKYLYLIVFTAIVNTSFGQAEKAYITKDGNYSDNPKNAASYVIIEKLPGDSAYSAIQYDMRDTILVSGFYKDEHLSIPNGKFIYYQKNHLVKSRPNTIIKYTQKVDTNNFKSLVGYFINGKRAGSWTQYFSDGRIDVQYTFEDDKMNGPFKSFVYGDVFYRSEGTMVDDLQEGKFFLYSRDSLLIAESNYFHGRDTGRIVHLHPAHETNTFYSFLEKNLKKYRKELLATAPTVKFVVDKTGRITKPEIVKGVSPAVDAAIISAIALAPAFAPGIYDDAPIEQKLARQLWLFRRNGYNVSYGGMDYRYPTPHTITLVYYFYGGRMVGTGLAHH